MEVCTLRTVWWSDRDAICAAVTAGRRTARFVVPHVTRASVAFGAFVDTGGHLSIAPWMYVEAEFDKRSPHTPKVYAPEHVAASPHRNGDGSLCLWYPLDPPDQKWVYGEDDLGELFLMTAMHLRRETLWKLSAQRIEDRVWPGPERPHGYHWMGP